MCKSVGARVLLCVCLLGRVKMTLSHWGCGGLCVVDVYANEFVERHVVRDQDVQARDTARVSNQGGMVTIDGWAMQCCGDLITF